MWSLILWGLVFSIDYAFKRGWISQRYNPSLLWGPIFSKSEREK
jgi:hypothetical protein